MAIDSISNSLANTSTAVTKTSTDAAAIADNFDAFLQLLTTQLKNQNPLEPMDTNEFTNQLVQFSSVEQTLKTNEHLENLISLSAGSATTAVVSYIGKEVTASGASAYLKDGKASWEYNLAAAAPNTSITIRNAAGTIVHNDSLSLASGKGNYNWDGKTQDGTNASDGIYSITINAKNANGNNIQADTSLKGIVEAIDLSGSEPVATISGIRVNLSNIKEIRQPGSS